MLFQEISTAFWRRAVFMDCDVNTLMSLIQTNKFMYERRKYLYHLCFIRLIKSFTIHEFYTCNIEKIHSIYKINLDLFVRNKVLQTWYLKYNLKEKTLMHLIRKLFIKHNMMDLCSYLKNKTHFISLVKEILTQYINHLSSCNVSLQKNYTYNNESYTISLTQ